MILAKLKTLFVASSTLIVASATVFAIAVIYKAGYKAGGDSDRDEIYKDLQEMGAGFVEAKKRQQEVTKILKRFRDRPPEIITKEIERVIKSDNCLEFNDDTVILLNSYNQANE